jgi:hypothetical protein
MSFEDVTWYGDDDVPEHAYVPVMSRAELLLLHILELMRLQRKAEQEQGCISVASAEQDSLDTRSTT